VGGGLNDDLGSLLCKGLKLLLLFWFGSLWCGSREEELEELEEEEVE